MSNNITIRRFTDAPFAIRASAAGAAGSWAADTYSFLLIAWDSADETDDEYARCVNWGVGLSSADVYPSIYNGLAVTLNQTVTLTWTAPRRRPHHYAVYVQAAASYQFDENGEKILPAAANRVNGDIPGWATSVVLPNSTHVQRSRQVACDAIATDDSYRVNGNRFIGLHAGTVVSPYPTGGLQNIDDVELGIDEGGEFTKAFVTTTVVGTDSALLYTESPIRLADFDGTLDPVQHLHRVTLDPVTGFDPASVDFTTRSHKGFLSRMAQTLPYSQESIRLTVEYISMFWTAPSISLEPGGHAMAQLCKWMEMGIPLLMNVEQDTGNAVYYRSWVVYLLGVNDYGFEHMHMADQIELLLKVERSFETDTPYEYWAITGGTATDGLKAVSATPTYDSANDETDIVFTDTETASISGDLTAYLVTGTKMRVNDAGGRLELWDRP